jgi:hypothetical protein
MNSDESLWRRVVDTHTAALEASETFMREATDRVEVLRRALRGTVVERLAALGASHRMAVDERKAIFPDLLELCTSQKFGCSAQDIVLGLPRDWVIDNIEAAARPLLDQADNIDYLMLLSLYERLGNDLAMRLAREGASSSDFDIRELGEEYLQQNTPPGPDESDLHG